MPFTHRQAGAMGITRRELQSRAYRKLLRGIYIRAEAPVGPYEETRAALLAASDGAFASHHTAARLWGGIVPHSARAHVSVPRGRPRSPREDLAVHSSSRTPTSFRGQAVTTPLDTFLDCATALDLLDLVILGDSLVRKRRITTAELLEGCRRATGRGARRARTAAALVREGVDSAMETRARLLRVLSGLPELETDIRFYDERGRLRRRLDAGDRKTRTAVEYDGRQHVAREEQWESDIGRREEFEDEAWRIVVLTSKDIYRTPGETVERLRRILRARGMTIGPARDDWRRYFPGHP
ncbi:Transcriptional regulator, AbiEi antitoxin, Type IV TA system [Ornithinimicrobium cerasi]|uniref:Transcriptional regulator, AbiEi antitoxin, Type IV TA system n=2 Tax=Ornithinimicrobium cerasi TaxID=2248773 RepID=A0A285VMP9_9MICO|nr:Transcriptional regulator, AbiEi antitoxin, Type IV TA system [Ornithinimicrobium cerasi]